MLDVYACKNKDVQVLLQSSSGGVFSLLAENEISKGNGVIAAHMSGLTLKHIRITDIKDIPRLRGSKYLRSQVDYNIVQNTDMFVGTPCQIPNITGLKVDLVCNGTPTHDSFNEYCKQYNISEINFRDKKYGWNNYYITTDQFSESFRDNKYMIDFISKVTLEERCKKCTLKSRADITLGDFWGIEHTYPAFDSYNGVSLVIIHTDKGLKCFNEIRDKMDYIKVDINKAIKYNPNINRGVIL